MLIDTILFDLLLGPALAENWLKKQNLSEKSVKVICTVPSVIGGLGLTITCSGFWTTIFFLTITAGAAISAYGKWFKDDNNNSENSQ